MSSKDEKQTEVNSSVCFRREFEKHLPAYLAIGMRPEEYWDGDCELVRFYCQAHERQLKEFNYQAWLQGLYIYEAIADLSPILHAFADKNSKPVPYPEEPHPITEEDRKAQEEREKRKKMEEIKAKIEVWAAEVNARFAKGGENNGGI